MLSWKVIRQYGHFIIFCLKSKHFSWNSYGNWKYLLIHLNLRNYKACIEIYISGELWFLWQSLGNGGLNENRPHWHRHFYTWFLVDGAVESYGEVQPHWRKYVTRGRAWNLKFCITSGWIFTFSLQIKMWFLSSCICCHADVPMSSQFLFLMPHLSLAALLLNHCDMLSSLWNCQSKLSSVSTIWYGVLSEQ